MKQCKKCGNDIPNRMVIDGETRNLRNRKYCVDCSPFGSRNTVQLEKELEDEKRCSRCNEIKSKTDFYKKGNRWHSFCKQCHNEHISERSQERKRQAILDKGGKCSICGYDKNYAALEFHHRDASEKDMVWNRARLMSNEIRQEELDKCDLLCSNCHKEIHYPHCSM